MRAEEGQDNSRGTQLFPNPFEPDLSRVQNPAVAREEDVFIAFVPQEACNTFRDVMVLMNITNEDLSHNDIILYYRKPHTVSTARPLQRPAQSASDTPLLADTVRSAPGPNRRTS